MINNHMKTFPYKQPLLPIVKKTRNLNLTQYLLQKRQNIKYLTEVEI